MPLTLDHIFIFCESHQAALPESIGLTPGSPNRHAGQGTANARYYFENAYLELIWIEDAAEAQSEITRPTGLWERSSWRETGASPIGLAFRQTDPTDSLPFETWPYRPAYLPDGMEIPIAVNSTRLNEPLIFIVPGAAAPIDYPMDRTQPLNHAAGHRRITRVRVDADIPQGPSAELDMLSGCALLNAQPAGLITRHASKPHLTIEFDDAASEQSHSFSPAVPLTFDW